MHFFFSASWSTIDVAAADALATWLPNSSRLGQHVRAAYRRRAPGSPQYCCGHSRLPPLWLLRPYFLSHASPSTAIAPLLSSPPLLLSAVALSLYSIRLCTSSLQQLFRSFIGSYLHCRKALPSQHTTAGCSRFSSFPLSSASVVPEHLFFAAPLLC
jgi:hypothetical protein